MTAVVKCSRSESHVSLRSIPTTTDRQPEDPYIGLFPMTRRPPKIRKRTMNTPDEDALEQWAASDKPTIRKDATMISPTEVGHAQMRELLIAAADPEQLEEIERVAEPPTRS